MRVSIIVAIAENGVIGRDGGLPWRLSEDLKRFKKLTMGKPIVMGRKTFQSIGKPLPGRPNIVITRDKSFRPEGVHVVCGFDQALETAVKLTEGEVMIIGGAEIYRLALAVAERMYLTKVHDTPKGDAYFPDYERAQWREISRDAHSSGVEGRPAYDFVVLERLKGAI